MNDLDEIDVEKEEKKNMKIAIGVILGLVLLAITSFIIYFIWICHNFVGLRAGH